ncbi:MAG: type IV toxin-antitoxin system AbiEi family antitoxin domain-containing protein [Elusimicrobia bacterium]|nr:type IV toxin-antitoxin system AbiEi family antitoxin domain-containing protein [Elusimicrobiota bacterium]
MKWSEIDGKLSRSGLRLFTDREFRGVTGATPMSAKFLLIRYTRRGLLRRFKRGLYAAAGRLPSKWSLANRLYQPSYVSLESALSYYGLIPETVYSVTSVTTKSTREFDALGADYLFRAIKRKAFFGYRSVEIEGQSVLLAEKEKALADYLYFVFLKKAHPNDRLRLEGVSRRDLWKNLKAFDNPGLLEWSKHDFKITDHRTKL